MKSDSSPNIILADFIGERISKYDVSKPQWRLPMCDGYYPDVDNLEFGERWERLMPVWYKFRDLKVGSKHKHRFSKHRFRIKEAILYEGVSEACKLLAEGIRWYNSTQNKEQ